MCGICGTYGSCESPLIRNMCEIMGHRGPDDEGVYLDRAAGIALGVKRLSIIDLETGHQPIHNEDETIRLVLNGEIYNYMTLRDALQRKGHSFYTKSDTETVVHLYEDLGERCLHELNGMFAFALWDKRQTRLFLARDRLGIKPLYYVDGARGEFAFASELKTLLRLPYLSAEIDLDALDAYITLGYVPAPLTILKGVKKLLPGHLIRMDKHGLCIERYWDVPIGREAVSSEEECPARLRDLLEDSVRLRLVSDVPLGALLSGGIDSSTVVALMSQFSSRVKTFSVGFEKADYDETTHARIVAQRFGTDHLELIMKPEVDLLPRLVWYLDEPIADQAAVPTYLICRLAKSRVTVVLSGEGGDEQFAGYPRYILSLISDRYSKAPPKLKNSFLRLVDIPAFPEAYRRVVRKLTYAAQDPMARNLRWVSNFSPEEKAQLYSDRLLAALADRDLLDLLPSSLRRTNWRDPLSPLMHLDMKTWLVDDILMKVDRMSMANSLEARVPFLDHRVVEFSATIPAGLKLKGLTTKYILKRMARSLLPKETIRRKKQAFLVPTNLWFREELRDFARGTLLDSRFEKRGYFNQSYVRRILDEQLSGKSDNSQKLWNLMILELWHRQFADP